MRHISGWMCGLAALGLLAGCAEGTPTSDDPGLVPVEARTVEVRLSFDEFARDFRVFGGFAGPAELPRPWIADRYMGDLDARALMRFGALPPTVAVRPAAGGDTQVDSSYVPVQGRIVLYFDTLTAVGAAPWQVEVGATGTPWHLSTARWGMAVDTLGAQTPWPEAGGGPVRPLWSGPWNPADGDSIVVAVDSATVSELTDLSLGTRGIRISTVGEGNRLRLLGAQFRVDVRSQVNPDTLVELSAQGFSVTFIYTPEPQVDQSQIQVGGTPARRSVFRVALPPTLDASSTVDIADLCAIVECPVALTADRLLYAGLVFTTEEVTPRAFAPADTLTFDVRPVLSPDRLPRSPLGTPVQALGRRVPPTFFRAGNATEVEVPVTRYIRDILRGTAPGEDPIPSTLALLSVVEPTSLEFAAFSGPGGSSPPVLRLILTLSEGVTLP